MNDHVIEVVTFKLIEGADVNEFMATIPATNTFIKSCKGFVRRCLSRNEDGTWLEHVEWESMEAAIAAGKAFIEDECCAAMMPFFDQGSIKSSHNHIMTRLD